MQPADRDALRTCIYVDGYNLYYGCLKNTSYKWLDLRALAQRLLANVPYERDGIPVCYDLRVPAVKYFTAPILNSFARAFDSVACQVQYHTALRGHLGSDIQIITGYHDARRARAHSWIGSKPAGECPLVDIWKLEEKQSDVALALHDKHAHWTRTHILDEEFAASQLPSMVRLASGAVHKPLTWYPCPHLLIPVYEEAKRFRGSGGAARRWLNEPCAELEGRLPDVRFARECTRASRLSERLCARRRVAKPFRAIAGRWLARVAQERRRSGSDSRVRPWQGCVRSSPKGGAGQSSGRRPQTGEKVLRASREGRPQGRDRVEGVTYRGLIAIGTCKWQLCCSPEGKIW